MDDIERAIVYVFDESGATPPELKKQAQQFCDQLKQLPNCCQLFLERVDISSYEGVRFWCLAALQEALRARYASMDAAEQIVIKQKLTGWLQQPVTRDGRPLASFLRNKIAQLVVYIVQAEFPKQWPSFFNDLIGMLAEGPQAVDMFCRVLLAIDQDVVSLEIPRTPEEIQRSMNLKDVMRETCIKQVTDACISLVASLHASNPDLAAAVLDAISRYVNWIDIGLVANDRFVPLLFALLGSESEALCAGAVEVLTEVVSKRMDSEAKLRLLQQLSLVPVAAAWHQGLPGDADGELPLKCAKLLSALCTELLDCWKKVENTLVSLSAVGLAVSDEAAAEAQAAVEGAQAMLRQLLPALLACVRTDDEDVRLAAVPCLQAYANKLRATQKRLGALPEAHAQQIQPIFEAVAAAMRYPADAPGVEPSTEPAKSEWEETADVLAERRQELFVLFKNVAKLSPETTVAFLNAQLQAGLAAGATFAEVEAAITLLYEAGEGANEEMSKPGCGALGQLALALMQVDAPGAQHRLVALALMETYVRYHRVLAQHQAVLSRTLTFFLGAHGIGHQDVGVGARACYLFCRLVKNVRSSMNPLVADLLAALQPHLARIATSPRPEPPSATKSPAGTASATDDRLYAHEAAGLLVGGEELPVAQQLACLTALMQPLLAQIERSLPAVSGAEGDAAVGLVIQALEGMNRLSKGLTLQLCTVKRPAIGESLAAPLQAALRIPQAAPGNRALHARVISFLHRLVECLGPHLLPYLPAALSALLPPDAERADLQDAFLLVHQLITRYKAALQPLLASVLPEIVRRVHLQLPADWDWTGRANSAAVATTSGSTGAASEEAREMAELQKAYFSLLHSASGNQLAGALLQAGPGNLEAMLKALLAAACGHVEPATRRGAVQVLQRIVTEVGTGAQPFAGYQDFVLQLVGPVALHSTLTSGLDVRDAAVIALLGDLATLLQALLKQGGQPLRQHIAANVLPPLSLSHEAQEQLLKALDSGDQKALKAVLRSLVQASPSAPPNSKPRRPGLAGGKPVNGIPGAAPGANGMLS